MIHGIEAKLSGKPHSHDIDFSEEERRLIEEQSQRLETWKKSPIGILHTMKDLQSPLQSEECMTDFTKPVVLPGGTVPSQPLQDSTRKLQIVFPSIKEPTQQPENSAIKDFGSPDKVKDYFKNLNKEELELLHSLMKKLDLHQLQSETTTNAAGGISSDETISAHTTSSLPPSDTEGTPSTASEPTAQLPSPIQTVPELHPSESQSAESSATSPDMEPSLQPTMEEPTQQDAVIDGEIVTNTEKSVEDSMMEHQHDNLDSEGTAFTPGMIPAHNPMAAMATMGPFIPSAAAAGFMPTMLHAPISPYMMPPQVYYYQMLQHAHYNQMLQQTMAAAVINSPTLAPSNQEDGHFFYQQKSMDAAMVNAGSHSIHHQAEVNVDPVEVTTNSDHIDDEQLRGKSPLQVQADFTSSGFPASNVPPVNLHLEQAAQGISMAPPSFTGTVPTMVTSSPHLQSSSENTSSNNSQIQFASEDHQMNNSNKDLKIMPPDIPASFKTEPVSTHIKMNHTPQRETSKNYINHHNASTTVTGSSRTSNPYTWKQPQSGKQDNRQSSNVQQQIKHHRGKYDGDTIDHELSQIGLHNDFPDGIIPSMVFSSESKRRKTQT